jgi:hypothetical protein
VAEDYILRDARLSGHRGGECSGSREGSEEEFEAVAGMVASLEHPREPGITVKE